MTFKRNLANLRRQVDDLQSPDACPTCHGRWHPLVHQDKKSTDEPDAPMPVCPVCGAPPAGIWLLEYIMPAGAEVGT
jgi:hypothetical protein